MPRPFLSKGKIPRNAPYREFFDWNTTHTIDAWYSNPHGSCAQSPFLADLEWEQR